MFICSGCPILYNFLLSEPILTQSWLQPTSPYNLPLVNIKADQKD